MWKGDQDINQRSENTVHGSLQANSYYSHPRPAPHPPPNLNHHNLIPRSSKSSLRSFTSSVLNRHNNNNNHYHNKPPSAYSASVNTNDDTASLISARSARSARTLPGERLYNTMHNAPLPVVSSHSITEEEEDCPVCLEPLSFSFRLPGEKPHIVPECGHALHEACFTAVYGPPPNAANNRTQVPRKSNLGVCGVCRRPMKVGDGDGGKSNKLAALTGMGNQNTSALYPGREGGQFPSSQGVFSPTSSYSGVSNVSNVPGAYGGAAPGYNASSATLGRKRQGTTTRSQDPTDDDPIEVHGKSYHDPGYGAPGGQYIVSPSISIRPEFSSLTRSHDQSQPLTCIVVVELPGKRGAGSAPGPVPPQVEYGNSRKEYAHSGHSSPRPDRAARQYASEAAPGGAKNGRYASSSNGDQHSLHGRSNSIGNNNDPAPSYHSPRPTSPVQISQTQSSAFAAITEDLRNRIIDWKGHPLSDLGPLQMYDLLSVRRESLVREFYVYLFREALICVVEEKKRSLGRLLSNASGFSDTGVGGPGGRGEQKGVLRLKGRIYVRHIKHVTASSAAGEMSLTIDMEDELASFILIYRERETMEAWKARIEALVSMFHQQNPSSTDTNGYRGNNVEQVPPDIEEFGGSQKAMRMLSGATTSSSGTQQDSLLGTGTSSRSSSTSHNSYGQPQYASYSQQHKLSGIGEDDESNYSNPSPIPLVQPHLSSGPSNNLAPLPHPPMDLILIISVPPPNASPSTAQLKIRVIKATLDFLIASMGHGDRLSLVTFEVGTGGKVRKTPFLSCASGQKGRERLDKFVDGISVRDGEEGASNDEFLVRGSRDEKTDVVTAVNHGLDVVLQRKAKNPISSMLLVSDASDSTRRAQMDLVLARAEAANVPIHSFGYGRSHDPASLWLMSNHTSGTYTFVKDWYDLRECVAGCVGGMMSIGLLSMKLHMKVVDGTRFRIRKVSGGPSSILASDGQNVDVDVGELRYGERKEMLIEMELDNTDLQAKLAAQQRMATSGNGHHRMGNSGRTLNATDQFVQSLGLEALAIDDGPDFADGMLERMIDEVPVVEVDGSFFDPAASKHVSRLAHPVLLTVTLLPPSSGPSQQQNPAGLSDPVIVRRRMELLASDMITRALVLVSRRNFQQAQKILGETKRILHTVLQTISRSLPPPNSNGGTVRNRKEILTLGAVRAMQAMLQDLQILTDALDENVDLFAHDQRNFGAQQAMILRDQKSWSGRSATERLFWTTDNSIELVSRSTDWVTRD